MNHCHIANAAALQCPFSRFGTGPERHFAIKPMNTPFLPAAQHAERPWIKRFPNRPEHLMHVSDTICPRPPRSEPGDSMMLVHHEVEPLLPAVPAHRSKDRFATATAANNVNPVDRLLR